MATTDARKPAAETPPSPANAARAQLVPQVQGTDMPEAAVLAQVPVAETGFFDPLYRDFLSEEPFVSSRFPCLFRRPECWSKQARRRLQTHAPAELWRELTDAHERWGAPAASRRSLAELAGGNAVAVFSGQQPDALGGPLYTLHKVLTSIAVARAFEARTGTRAVPVFWSANEDSDFEEVRSVRFQSATLEAVELELPASARVPGGMVGEIPADALTETWERAQAAWKGLTGEALTALWIAEARARARDLGDAQAILLLQAFGDEGLVVLDPRLPSFRGAARPLYERYLERQARVREAVDQAGRQLAERGYERAVGPTQSEFALFAIRDGTRAKLTPQTASAALAEGLALSPNVVLRPVVQDAVLPSAVLVAGPGEVAYLAQLREVYTELDVPMSLVFPRLSATWLPSAARTLVREHGLDAWELVRDTDRSLRELSSRLLPESVRAELERLREQSNQGLTAFAEPARTIDASLPQLVESVRSKIDFQYGRLLEALVAKVRARFDRAHPAVGRLRHALLPNGRPQERRLAWLDVVARGGAGVLATGLEIARAHAERAATSGPVHYLIAMPPGPDA